LNRRTRRELIDRLRCDARRIAVHFGLRFRSVEAERANVRSRYGVCFSDGEIRIRLRHARTGDPLKYSSLVNTLCHELAHLRYFHHGERFKAFYLELLAWARSQAIYRPGPAGVGEIAPPRSAGSAARRSAAARAAGRAAAKLPTAAPGPTQLGLFG